MKKNIFHLGRLIIGCLCQEESQASKGHERGERKSATQSVKMETLLGCARYGQWWEKLPIPNTMEIVAHLKKAKMATV